MRPANRESFYISRLDVENFSFALKGSRIVSSISRMTSEATGGRRERGHAVTSRFQSFEILTEGARRSRNKVDLIFHPKHLYTMDGRDINELSTFL